MTVLSRTPQNTNYLQPTKFLLTFSRIPNVQYFCQSINLPGISVGQATVNYPSLDVSVPGNKLTYNSLNVTFTVDEILKTYIEIQNWFHSFASPKGTDIRNTLSKLQNDGNDVKKPWYSDATLTILTNLNNPSIRINFINIFPTTLSDIQFDTKMSADDIITCDANFTFERYEIVPINS